VTVRTELHTLVSEITAVILSFFFICSPSAKSVTPRVALARERQSLLSNISEKTSFVLCYEIKQNWCEENYMYVCTRNKRMGSRDLEKLKKDQ
jgi:hypothetical protein